MEAAVTATAMHEATRIDVAPRRAERLARIATSDQITAATAKTTNIADVHSKTRTSCHAYALRSLVFAAFTAARWRPTGPFVFAAFFAAALRDVALRRRAAELAWRDSALGEAAEWPSGFSASRTARDRRVDGFLCARPSSIACTADSRVRSDVVPFAGAGSFTPARRAFCNPMAMACFVERAPCFPWRMCSISSRTNSPACVDGAFPSRLSFCARRIVSFSGMGVSFHANNCARGGPKDCMATTNRWSRKVTETSNALDLKHRVFTKSPREIAR